MTRARGAGANAAFRDAALLCNTLTEVQNDDKPLGLATHEGAAECRLSPPEATIADN